MINRIRERIDHKQERTSWIQKWARDSRADFLYIIEQVNEWQTTLYLNIIDHEKAFESIHRESLWKIMRSYDIPEKPIIIIKEFYKDFKCSDSHEIWGGTSPKIYTWYVWYTWSWTVSIWDSYTERIVQEVFTYRKKESEESVKFISKLEYISQFMVQTHLHMHACINCI